MRSSSRILFALVSAALLVGTGAMGAAASPRPAAPAVAVTQTAKAASPAAARAAQSKNTQANGPALGQHRSSPSDGSIPGTTGSVEAGAKAHELASKSKSQIQAKPGVASHTLSGTVTDEHSNPLFDITVDVCTASNCLYAPEDQSTTTNGGGNWSITVPDGWYSITFGDFDNYVYAIGWYSDSGIVYSPDNASRIHLNGSDVGSIDVAMQPWELISGHVRNSASANLKNIVIEGWIDDSFYSEAESLTDGSYEMLMPPGDTTLFLYDLAGTYPGGWWVNPGLSNFQSDATPITITNSSVANVNATLTAARHIKGKVTNTSGVGLQYGLVEAFCDGQ